MITATAQDTYTSLMNSEMTDEIDEIAREIEATIQTGKEINEEFEGVFDSKYRRMNEAESVDIF